MSSSETTIAPLQKLSTKMDEKRPNQRIAGGVSPKLGSASYATGKRKSSTAKVWLKVGGSGSYTVNTLDALEYFGATLKQVSLTAFRVLSGVSGESPSIAHGTMSLKDLGNIAGFDIICRVEGGGKSAQSQAIMHGLSKILSTIAPETNARSFLKKADLLRRDSRRKERQKPGMKGARARYQFSKR